MTRFARFVALGISSPSLVCAGLEPMPAPTLRGRLVQWRRRRAWPAELRTEAEAWAAANPMSFDEFMDRCRVMSARAFGVYDDDE